MSSSFTITQSTTFTITHARHMAAKVAADLKRMQRFYDLPGDQRIDEFEDEIIQLLKAGYLGTVTYGFRRDGQWTEPTIRYTAQDLYGASTTDDDPGRVYPGADISDAAFCSYLTYNAAWNNLTEAERETFEQGLPFKRTGAPEPGISGYLVADRTYSAGGRALNRFSVRGW